MKLKKKTTQRGFDYYEFIDRYDVTCSLQKSSLAFENAIWFGCDDADPKIFRQDGKGWQPLKLPTDGDVLMNTRMHLTQGQVQALLPILNYFAETGELPEKLPVVSNNVIHNMKIKSEIEEHEENLWNIINPDCFSEWEEIGYSEAPDGYKGEEVSYEVFRYLKNTGEFDEEEQTEIRICEEKIEKLKQKLK